MRAVDTRVFKPERVLVGGFLRRSRSVWWSLIKCDSRHPILQTESDLIEIEGPVMAQI